MPTHSPRGQPPAQPTGKPAAPDGGTLFLESGFTPTTLRALTRMGYHLSIQVDGYGGYRAILYDAKNHVYRGASESRKDGEAVGY